MKRRLQADYIDFSEEKLEEAGITKKQTFENYNLDTCVEQIIKYIQEEREKRLSIQEKYRITVPELKFKQNREEKREEEREISH